MVLAQKTLLARRACSGRDAVAREFSRRLDQRVSLAQSSGDFQKLSHLRGAYEVIKAQAARFSLAGWPVWANRLRKDALRIKKSVQLLEAKLITNE